MASVPTDSEFATLRVTGAQTERDMDACERAAELDERIERTDDLIDEIVYELYGLTDKEIRDC